MIQWQDISIPLGLGVDTKTDPKMVGTGKFTNLVNGVFKKGGRLSKRNGYTSIGLSIIGGGTIGTQQMVEGFGESLLCASSGVLYDYSTNANAWKNAGKWDSIKDTNVFISGAFQLERNANSTISGNYSVIAYDQWSTTTSIEAGSGTAVYISVLDLTTNTLIKSDFVVSTNGRYSKVFTFANGDLGIFYYTPTGTKIAYKAITIASGAVTLGSEITVAADAVVFNDTDHGYSQYDWIQYDIIANGSNVTLAYNQNVSAKHVKLITLNSAGASQATYQQTNIGNAYPITLCASPNGNIWVYFAQPTPNTSAPATGAGLTYFIVSSSLSLVLGTTFLVGSFSYIRQLAAQSIDNSNQYLYFSSVPFVSGSQAINMVTPTIYRCQNSTSGSVADPFAYLYNLDIFGKTFTQNGNTYLPCVYPSPDQNTGFLIDVSDGHAAAKFLFDTAESAFNVEVDNTGTGPAIGGYWWRYPGFLSVASTYNTTHQIFASGKIIQFNPKVLSSLKFVMGSCLVDLEWNNQDSFQGLNTNGIIALNGSIPGIYDGNTVTELGFNNRPEINGVASTTGGGILAGTYEYQAVYQWSDARGNLYQSEDSDPLTVTTTGSTSAVTLTVKIPAITQKSYSINPIYLYIYRTLAGGTIPYDVVTGNAIKLTGTAGIVTYSDALVDSILSSSSSPIYTNGGAIVSNSSPPPSMLMWLNNNRLWMVNSEDQSIWYSKTFASLTGIEVSALLTVAPDVRFGNIVAGQAMDEKTTLIKETGLTYFVGDGADDSGQNSTISLPQIIPASIGGSNSKAVLLFPGGVLFRGANNRGLYLLSRAIQVEYIGGLVEQYNTQDIKSIKAIQNTTEIRFLTSSGSSILFDYYFGQWGVFSNHQGNASTIWNGVYVYARTDGLLFQESATSFLDNATSYALTATTAWIKATVIQGFQRVRRALSLGDFTSGSSSYGVQIEAAYDFSTTFQTAVSYTLGTAASATPFQYRERLPIQKCDTLQLRITELPTGASGQYIDFNDLGLEIGAKQGLNKLPASQSVG